MKRKVKQIIALLLLCTMSVSTVFASSENVVEYTNSAISAGEYKEPTRDGYTFGGWYLDKNCTSGKEFNPQTDAAKLKTNSRIYAKWIDDIKPTLTVDDVTALTNSSTVTITGTVKDAGGLKSLTVKGTAVTVGSDGKFSQAVTLTEGSNSIAVVATDTSNNAITVTKTVVYDKTNPTLTVNNITTLTNGNKVTVSGTTSDTNGIQSLTVNGTTVTVSSNGSFSKEITLTSGSNTVTVVATDKAGNKTTVTKTVTYDNTNPTLSVNNITSLTNSNSVTVSGTISDTNGIKSLTVNGTAVTVSSNAFSTNVTLTEGSNTITVVATDNANNSTTVTKTVTCDKTNPTLTVNDVTSLTNSNKVTVSGKATDTNGIQSLTVNGTTVTLGNDGTFSTQITLSDGSNTITVVATDKAGNKSTVTKSTTYDKTNPTLSVNNIAALTNNGKVTISGTVSDASCIKTLTVNGTAVTVSNGSFSAEVTLTEGSNSIAVVATDNAGNSTTVTKTTTYDATKPTVTVDTIPTLTNKDTYTVTGTVSDTNGIKSLVINEVTVTVGADGKFSHTFSLGGGANPIIITATDNAGNKTEVTKSINCDKVKPTLTVTDIESPTPIQRITLSGTVTDESGIRTLVINGVPVTPGSTGSFSSTFTLSQGTNTYTIVATDVAGNQTTVVKTIIFDNTAPTITVSAPTATASGSPTYANNAEYTVSGKITDANGIKNAFVNGKPVVLGNDGTFNAVVELDTTKTNEITVTAIDKANNNTSTKRYVALQIDVTYHGKGGTFDNEGIEFRVRHWNGSATATYYAEEGMTWRQFADSRYNISNTVTCTSTEVVDSSISQFPIQNGDIKEKPNNILINEMIYYTASSGGSD